MSITAELRQYIEKLDDLFDNLGMVCRMLAGIADRIDAEYESMYRELTTDMKPMTDENMADHGWVRLPVDADGEYIHIGDVMEIEGRIRFEVRFFTLTESEWTVNSEGWFPEKLRHYHAPTVEDVLREMADRIYADEDEPRSRDAIVAEYAAKLRLAGDAE